MSENAQSSAAEAASAPLLLSLGAVAAIIVALLATTSLVLLLLMQYNLGRLSDQVRKLNQNVKALEEAFEELREQRAATPPPAPRSAVPRATHIDAADPQRDCVIRPGSKNPLGDCLK